MSNQATAPVETLRKIPSTEQLMEKLQKTIKFAWNIENKIHMQSIDRWLSNFTGEALSNEGCNEAEKSKAATREKQLALFLLCNFVYYNENEIKHLARLLFRKYIHTFCIEEGKEICSEQEVLNLLDNTKFSYLGNPSESSSYLLYLFRQENPLANNMFSDIQNGNKLVFIDDFSISGEQAVRYLKSKVGEFGPVKKYYVLLMVATEDALRSLEEIEGVTVLPCIVLTETAKVFSTDSIVFAGYEPTCVAEAKRMCEFYGEKIKTSDANMQSLGYGGCGYLFGAYYNVPNNTLPIFWSALCNWTPLFKRHDKQYFQSNINWGGHYV